MRIAFFTNEKQTPGSERACPGSRNSLLKVDYFSIKEGYLSLLERAMYDMIVICPKGKQVSWEEIVKTMGRDSIIPLITGKTLHLSQEKYVGFFNGQSCSLDIRDILYLESYYRKTRVMVAGSGSMRIRARLDEEEERLPKNLFVRINRHNIINMQYVRNVKGEVVEMQNGEFLYVNEGRRKKFERRYRDFLKDNCMML
jgi:hypothetical protein